MKSFNYDTLLTLDPSKYYIIQVNANSDHFNKMCQDLRDTVNMLPAPKPHIILMHGARYSAGLFYESDKPKAICLLDKEQMELVIDGLKSLDSDGLIEDYEEKLYEQTLKQLDIEIQKFNRDFGKEFKQQ